MRMLTVGTGNARMSFARTAALSTVSLTLVLLATDLGGCANANLTEVPPADVATDQYEGQTCDRLKSEAQTLNARKAELRPALFPSISEEEREHRLAQINGELKTLSLVSAEKCGTRR